MIHCKIIALSLLLSVERALTHTWIEQLSNIAENGSYYGFGYPRGFVDKGIGSEFNQEADKWLLPPPSQYPVFVHTNNLLCHPSQRTQLQSSDYPRLQALRGGLVAMRYAENGHATIPGGGKDLLGKPEKGGTVFVFGTQQPNEEEKLIDVLRWNRDGSGGDRRGLLLVAQDFDDGRCYQLGSATLAIARKAQYPNPMPGQPGSEHEVLCETDVRVPEIGQAKVPYTLYWVWQWPNAPGHDPNFPNGKDEYYTSCIDVDIVSNMQSSQADHPLLQQDPMPTAVPEFQSRGALTSDPLALYSLSNFGMSAMLRSQSSDRLRASPSNHVQTAQVTHDVNVQHLNVASRA